jgi:hypothetical protein
MRYGVNQEPSYSSTVSTAAELRQVLTAVPVEDDWGFICG